MRFVPYPKEAMHDVFVRKPCYEFPKEKRRYNDDRTNYDRNQTQLFIRLLRKNTNDTFILTGPFVCTALEALDA
jgi:hypothetical protein